MKMQDDQSTYEAFLSKHLQATGSQDDDTDMPFLKGLHGSLPKLSQEKRRNEDTNAITYYNTRFTQHTCFKPQS